MVKKTVMRVVCCISLCIVFACAAAGAAFAEETELYAYGDLRYTVEDKSITITDYVGRDEIVTVPNIIAGNPVNIIAPGVFKDNKYVKVVYLPGSITNIQEGAFGPGQQIKYGTPDNPMSVPGEPATAGNSGATTTATGDSSKTGGMDGGETSGSSEGDDAEFAEATEQTDGKTSTTNSVANGPVGVTLKNGSFVTVTYDGALVMVKNDGAEYVLDDTKPYTREVTSEGNVVIRDSNGSEVVINTEAGTVEYTNSNEEKRRYDSASDTIQSIDDSGNVMAEEVFGDVEASEDENELILDATADPSTASNASQAPVVAIVLVVVAALAGVVVYLRRLRKNKEEK